MPNCPSNVGCVSSLTPYVPGLEFIQPSFDSTERIDLIDSPARATNQFAGFNFSKTRSGS